MSKHVYLLVFIRMYCNALLILNGPQWREMLFCSQMVPVMPPVGANSSGLACQTAR